MRLVPRARTVAAVAATVLLVLSAAAHAAPTPSTQAWGTDGPVTASVLDDQGRLYIGGSFTAIGPRTGGLIATAAGTGALQGGLPEVVGEVRAIEPDGAGGWFIGGRFTAVGGQQRTNLAHVLADGSLDPTWKPTTSGGSTNTVFALDRSGDALYVGGDFTGVNGVTTGRLAKLSTTGAGDPDLLFQAFPNAPVKVVVANGADVYLGGPFGSAGGQPTCGGIARVSASDGACAPAWKAFTAAAGPMSVDAIVLASGALYAGGRFDSFGPPGEQVERTNLAKLDPTTGLPDPGFSTPAGPAPGGGVHALALRDDRLYVGGAFLALGSGGGAPGYLGRVDRTTGAVDLSWRPGPIGPIDTLAAGDDGLYLSGALDELGGKQAPERVAKIAWGSTTASAYDPRPSSGAYAIVPDGTRVLLGGPFATAGPDWISQSLIARILPSGRPDLTWRPKFDAIDATIRSLALGGGSLLVGGSFLLNVPGAAELVSNLGKVSTTTAAVSALTTQLPLFSAIHQVWALAAKGDDVYVGGRFDVAGPRVNLAKLSVSTGALDASWGPTTAGGGIGQGAVTAMAIGADGLYIGGEFDTVSSGGDVARAGLAKLSLTGTGAVDPAWNPGGSATGSFPSSPRFQQLLLAGPSMYVAGSFAGTIGGINRSRLVKLSATGTGAADAAFGAVPNAAVSALDLTGDELTVGGLFTKLGATDVPFLGRMSALSGATDAGLSLKPDAAVRTIARTPSRLWIGGLFGSVDRRGAGGYAMVDLTVPSASISVPGNGATYTVGQSIAAAYACSDPDGPEADQLTCTGTVPDGSPIDTSSTGTKSFEVEVVDQSGNTASQTVTYSVVPAPVPPPGGGTTPAGRAPVLSAFTLTPTSFRPAARGGPTTKAKGRKPKRGTRISFRLSRAATVTFTVVRGKKAVGRFTVRAKAGTTKVDFTGRLAGKRLAKGSYSLTAQARDAAGRRSKTLRKAFRVR